MAAAAENSRAVLSRSALDPAAPLLGIQLNELETHLRPRVLCSIIYNSQNMTTDEQMGKENLVWVIV